MHCWWCMFLFLNAFVGRYVFKCFFIMWVPKLFFVRSALSQQLHWKCQPAVISDQVADKLTYQLLSLAWKWPHHLFFSYYFPSIDYSHLSCVVPSYAWEIKQTSLNRSPSFSGSTYTLHFAIVQLCHCATVDLISMISCMVKVQSMNVLCKCATRSRHCELQTENHTVDMWNSWFRLWDVLMNIWSHWRCHLTRISDTLLKRNLAS